MFGFAGLMLGTSSKHILPNGGCSWVHGDLPWYNPSKKEHQKKTRPRGRLINHWFPLNKALLNPYVLSLKKLFVLSTPKFL